MTTCPCGNKTNSGIKCVPCQIDDKHPGLREFAQEIRGKCQPLPKYKGKRKDGTSPYSCKFEGKEFKRR